MLLGRTYYWQGGSGEPIGCDVFMYVSDTKEHIVYACGDYTTKTDSTVIKHRNNTLKILALSEDKIRISEYKKKNEPYERNYIEFANIKWNYDDIVEYNGIDVK